MSQQNAASDAIAPAVPFAEIRSGNLMALPRGWTIAPWLSAWSTAQIGVQPTGLMVLQELGLLDPLARLASPINRLFGRSVPSGRVVLDVRYEALQAGWRALGVHRAALFDVLHEAAIEVDDRAGIQAGGEFDRSAVVNDVGAAAAGADLQGARGLGQDGG